MSDVGARLMSFDEAGKAAGGLSRTSLRRRIAEGRFPKPVVISRHKTGAPARVAFVESEVLEAIAAWIVRARAEESQFPSVPAIPDGGAR